MRTQRKRYRSPSFREGGNSQARAHTHTQTDTHTHTNTHTHTPLALQLGHTRNTHTHRIHTREHTHTHTHELVYHGDTHTHAHALLSPYSSDTHATHTHTLTHTHTGYTHASAHTHTHTDLCTMGTHTHTHTHTHSSRPAARDEGRGAAAVAALEKEGLKPRFHQLDISDGASITALRDHLTKTHGGLDLLVNNAAIAYKVSDATIARHTWSLRRCRQVNDVKVRNVAVSHKVSAAMLRTRSVMPRSHRRSVTPSSPARRIFRHLVHGLRPATVDGQERHHMRWAPRASQGNFAVVRVKTTRSCRDERLVSSLCCLFRDSVGVDL